MGRTAGARNRIVYSYMALRWMDDALCREVDSDLFFPERDEGPSLRRAKAICRQCPVIQECLEWAVADPSLSGVLGGTSSRQRMQLRKEAGGQ